MGTSVSVGAGVSALECPVITGCGAIGAIAVSAAIIAYEPYFWLYEFPNKLEMLKNMHDMAVNQNSLFLGTVPLFLPDDRDPTIDELRDAYWKAGQLIMLIAENEDEESYETIIGVLPHIPSGLAVAEKYEHLFAPPPLGGGGDDDITKVGRFMKEKWEKTREKWNNGDIVGAMKEFKWIIAGSSAISLEILFENEDVIEKVLKSISTSGGSGNGSGG